jgi:transcriptional regulator with XRE-family HTH domain
MVENTLRQVLRQNVLNLLAEDRPLKSNESGVQRLVRLGVANGTAQRILNAEASVGLDVIEQVAYVLRVSPWRLLRPKNENVAETQDEGRASTARLAAQIERLPQEAKQAIQAIVFALTALPSSKKTTSLTNGDA